LGRFGVASDAAVVHFMKIAAVAAGSYITKYLRLNLRLLQIAIGRGGQGAAAPGPLSQNLSPNPIHLLAIQGVSLNLFPIWGLGRGV